MEYNTREEYMDAVRLFIGDREGEEVINFLKDVEDNSNFAEHTELVNKVKEWEGKYNSLLSDYRERFFTGGNGGGADPVNNQPPQEEEILEPTEETVTIDDLFEEREE